MAKDRVTGWESCDEVDSLYREVRKNWKPVDINECKDCGFTNPLNVDGRCDWCTVAFVAKIRSVAIIAIPWGLAEARRGGFAKY